MKAAILVESLTGNTRKAGEFIASDLQQEGWDITGVMRVREPDFAAIQDADMVIIGTWVHGLFVVGQGPWGVPAISQLPAIRGKQAAVFCTFALNPAKTRQAHPRGVGPGCRRHRGSRPQPLQARGAQRGVRCPSGGQRPRPQLTSRAHC
jgi:hypothetical protein